MGGLCSSLNLMRELWVPLLLVLGRVRIFKCFLLSFASPRSRTLRKHFPFFPFTTCQSVPTIHSRCFCSPKKSGRWHGTQRWRVASDEWRVTSGGAKLGVNTGSQCAGLKSGLYTGSEMGSGEWRVTREEPTRESRSLASLGMTRGRSEWGEDQFRAASFSKRSSMSG